MSYARLTSPCSRRAAARRDPRREHRGPRPAAEGHLVRPPLLLLALTLVSCSAPDAWGPASRRAGAPAQASSVSQSTVIYEAVLSDFAKGRNMQCVALQAFTEPVSTSAFPEAHEEHGLYQALLRESTGAALDQPIVPPQLNVAFVSKAEVEAAEGDNWSEFITRYPDAQGLTRLSSIGFDPKHQRAMLVVSIGFDHIGTSIAYVLKASNGQWQVANKHWLVMSIG
jgi:hypothetical protein